MRFASDPVETEIYRLQDLIAQMDGLLRDAREFIARKHAHDPEMPEIVDEIDEFLEGK